MTRLIALARCRGAPVAEVCKNPGPPVSKTDQTAQTDRRFETKGKFAAIAGQKAKGTLAKLTSQSDHRHRSEERGW
jgi:hypothetical protein